MNFTGKSKALILVHSAMKKVRLTEEVNVMLTPQFYTLKKEVLPVSYAYQAKRIAPSLFDGLLEEGKHYEYMVWKEDEQWVFLAYDLEMITTFLEEKGFSLEHVSKLFFAQQALEHFESPLSLGENEALIALEKMVVVIPRTALGEEAPSLVFDNTFTPKKGITLQGAYGSLFTLKQTLILSTIFMLLSFMFFVEGSRYSGTTEAIQLQIEEVLSDYPTLSSKYARDSLVSKYKTLDTLERKKRDIIKTLSGMIFKGVTLKTFEMNDKRFMVHFSCKDAQVFKRVKALAKEYHFKTVNVSRGHDLKIEGTL